MSTTRSGSIYSSTSLWTCSVLAFAALISTAIGVRAVDAAYAAPKTRPNICAGHPNGGSVRNTQNCATFYTCLNGQPILTPCPARQQFNHITGKCDLNLEAVECFQCPDAVGFADMPVINECQQFVRCFNNRSQQATCGAGLAFDRSISLCNRADLVNCPHETECPRKHARPIFTRHPDDCANFTVCANGVRKEFRCPGTLVLNLDTKQCDFANNTDCPEPEPPVQLDCPRSGGPLFSHPTDCGLSYRCNSDNTPKLYPCREGLHFDYDEQYCAPAAVVQCFGDRQSDA